MIKLTKMQARVLVLASIPMAATGVAGGVASFFNFRDILNGNQSAAMSVVAAGEGATLVSALVMLLLTLLGQHTPLVVRAALWILPTIASVAGGILAPTLNMKVVMCIAPLAMTVSGEGVALVARRVVAFQTGVDIEQQRRSGLLLWHANRATNGSGLGRKVSQAAVWRLTKQFASTDNQMSVQLAEVQRYRISEGADQSLASVLSGTKNRKDAIAAPVRPVQALSAAQAPEMPAIESQAVSGPSEAFAPVAAASPVADAGDNEATPDAAGDGFDWIKSVLDEAGPVVESDPTLGLLTSDEVAVRTNRSPGTIRSWIHRGKLSPAYRDAHNRAYFRPEDVDAMIS